MKNNVNLTFITKFKINIENKTKNIYKELIISYLTKNKH